MDLGDDYLRLIAQRVLRATYRTMTAELHLPASPPLRERDIETFIENVKATSDGERKITDLLTFAAVRELVNLQISVSERLAVPWPHVEGKPRDYFPNPGACPYFAAPCAEVTDQTLRLWFDADGVTVWERRVSLDPDQ